MEISDKNNEPWYADYANYLASRVLPFRSTHQEKQKFFSDLRHYFWDEPFLFKQCAGRIIRRCMAEDEAAQILIQCHNGPSGGHHGIATTTRKVFEVGFYWPHIFQDAKIIIRLSAWYFYQNENEFSECLEDGLGLHASPRSPRLCDGVRVTFDEKTLDVLRKLRLNDLGDNLTALVVTTPAPVKAVEEVCVTCGSNHHFNHCPLTRGGNDFPVFHDNIQQFQQTAAVGNFLQRNQPSNLASQMKPPGFNQPNVQNNQNRYQGNNFNSNQNSGGNFNQNRQNNQNQVFQPPTNQPLTYQTPTSQIQGVLKTDFENYVKANDAVLKNVQNQGQNLQNQMANVTSLLTSLCDNFKNSASTSNSGTLPSQTVTNPRQQINAITTRSGKTLEEPSTPLVPTPDISIPQKELVQNPETSTEKVQNPNLENTAHVPSPGEG
ncbi:hypothetical protein Tco_0550915 [Tanacetum coccineum]